MQFSVITMAGLLLLGIIAGYLGGLAGVGGGILVVPALVYIFGFSQHQAQGTTLAMMLPPIGLLAAREYYLRGYVHISASLLLVSGYLLGSYLGGKMAVQLPDLVVKKIFAWFILMVSVKILFFTSTKS
ncbi:sulfite exporter TauE/SafE family protein [Thermoflavifilum thermophilum]|uniref:Probable membrane transporter protein n=1 Tax=Thermoflavifilum thermophilum TaxID=1393122 RepID=A0A1I7NIM4_9BACT|nr:sulfite exporter TauE/SafE family protein [Thermoflavifilum thermophilum]SFV34436.1 hypothetical protein SAMN05660895_1998 [Thermoflavifilum thermophilum]